MAYEKKIAVRVCFSDHYLILKFYDVICEYIVVLMKFDDRKECTLEIMKAGGFNEWKRLGLI